ncbi:hypothetical protein HID58_037363 [Brassica napus]|uniref:Uncharacterized protein n=1 Tax=Brassica napus TaxID=3708 RepID=A0ABQ8BL30_BRANA|nr:hypothetical protein HID58_037363 [Brassica napus]
MNTCVIQQGPRDNCYIVHMSQSGIEAPLPSEKQSISCALTAESTSLALSSSLTSTMTSASSSSTSLALTVASTESLEVVNTLSTTTSFAPMNTSLGSPVVVLSPSSSPVQTSSTLTFASPMTSSTVSSVLINTISGATAQDPESSVVSESDIAQVSSHQDDCNAPHNRSLSSENGMQVPPKFVPTLGAWEKPLLFKPPATPPQPSTSRDYDSAIVGNQLAALWPSLNDEILNKKPKSSHQTRTLQLPVEKLPSPELKADGKVRFPWAARLSPQSRNLYRAATPTYRLDGTPQISIPSKVLKLGPENKDEYIIGKDSMTAKSSPNGNPTTPKVLEDKDIVEPKTSNTLSGTRSPSSHLQHKKPATMLMAVTIPSTLVDSQSTPIDTQIMESFPSNITNSVALGSSGVDY